MEMSASYCGLEVLLDAGVAAGTAGDAGFATAGALCELVGNGSARGEAGDVVIALSGFSRWSWLGPSPSLIRARESGTVLLCQPLSA